MRILLSFSLFFSFCLAIIIIIIITLYYFHCCLINKLFAKQINAIIVMSIASTAIYCYKCHCLE